MEDWELGLTLSVNGNKKIILDIDPRITLLSYLRNEGLTGTKLGCGEGGCGACTCMLSSIDDDGHVINYNVNACLTPLASCDGLAITTIEGLGNIKDGLHPVQQRLAENHGSQCGFCTPGIIMSMHTQLKSNPNSSTHDMEDCMDGNLCRCTGYRPILDAAKSLVTCKGDCSHEEKSTCPNIPPPVNAAGETIVYNTTEQFVNSAVSCVDALKAANIKELDFPAFLTKYKSKPLHFKFDKIQWFQPTTLTSLLNLKNTFPDARIVVGNTEIGIETKFKGLEYQTFINPTRIPDLKITEIEKEGDIEGLRVGASVTINGLRKKIKELEATMKYTHELRGLQAIYHMLSWFASNQIRNVACVAGNIVTASPISDLNPMLMCLGATLRVLSADGQRIVSHDKFFLSYRKVDLKPNEVLESVFIPFTSKFEFVVPYKQARRREDDISIVTSGMRIELAPVNGQWIINNFAASFGGMAPTTINAPKTVSSLVGKPFTSESFDKAYLEMKSELNLPSEVPGGQAEYRMALAVSFLFKFYIATTSELQAFSATLKEELPTISVIESRLKNAGDNFITSPKIPSRGVQQYSVRQGGLNKFHPVGIEGVHTQDTEAERKTVGASLMHKSAPQQVSGEAIYTDDIPLPKGAAHAALVMSSRAHARILSVDSKPAEDCPGFVAFFSARDVTGSNHIGAVIKDEEVFATEFVKHHGAVIGVVIADTHDQAVYASKKVVVTYEDLPVIVSIEEAIAAKSFYPQEHSIISGDIEAAAKGADIVVEGTAKIGGQEHFYLETNCTVAVPLDGGQLEVFSSTQNPTKTQNFCAHVVGIPKAHVTARCKRMGGGFGGKETRSVFIAVTAALSAHLLGRAVSINIERDVDMSITGQRHAFLIDYKAGCTKDGMLKFLDIHLYNNAGFSLDLSQAIMDRALFHCDNTYFWPALRAIGTICITNQPSHTAFRGFGGPQGMMITEYVIEHLSSVSGIPALEFRQKNFYKEGDRVHFGQKLVEFHIPRLWDDLLLKANVAERNEAIDTFNKENQWKKRSLVVLPCKFGINFTAKFMNQGGALVHVYTDGTVLVAHGGTEMGQGLHTKMIQVAAQCFGISDKMVHIAETNTSAVANSSPTAASMSTDLYGMAVLDACEQILERLAPVRADLASDATWETLIDAAFWRRIDLSAHGYYAVDSERCGYDWDMQVTDNSERGHPFNYFTQSVACTEVEIDCLTGDSTLQRVDIIMDVGKSINPSLDIGQVEGAFIQGFGWSTMEELIWGDGQHKWVRPGMLFTRGPGTYKIPAFNDVPKDFRVYLADTDNKFCVHSSKAIGEPPLFLGCSAFFALQNAVRAAREEAGLSGYYPLDHPGTSERIRMGCADKFANLCTNNPLYHPKGSW